MLKLQNLHLPSFLNRRLLNLRRRKEIKCWIKNLSNMKGLEVSRDLGTIKYRFWISNKYFSIWLLPKYEEEEESKLNPKWESTIPGIRGIDYPTVDLYLLYYKKGFEHMTAVDGDYSLETLLWFKSIILDE